MPDTAALTPAALDIAAIASAGPGVTRIAGAPEGADARLLAALASRRDVLHVAREDVRAAAIVEQVRFFAPDLDIVTIPAWDTMPYDRVSPNPEIVARRIAAFSRLASRAPDAPPCLAVTTVGGLIQKVPPVGRFAGAAMLLAPGDRLPEGFAGFLEQRGFSRTEQVMEAGEYALRGGLIDLFPPGYAEPVRLDLFGDEIEEIRGFDAVSQRTTGKLGRLILTPMSEVELTPETIARFRSAYRDLFGAISGDPLYDAISAGQRYPGYEHWLPLFEPGLDTLYAYMPAAMVAFDAQTDIALRGWETQIDEHYAARRDMLAQRIHDTDAPYRPVPPERLYLLGAEWDRPLLHRRVVHLSPFAPSEAEADVLDAGARPGRSFADVRARAAAAGADQAENVFDALARHVAAEWAAGRATAVAAYTEGSLARIGALLAEHGLSPTVEIADRASLEALAPGTLGLIVLPLEHGFTTDRLSVITEPDILGDRLSRPGRRRRRRAEKFIADAGALAEGDLVVHMDHGIGRFEGLETIDVGGAAHDCLKLVYADEDKLFLPVENIEVLSRYGSEQAGAQLDRLGGAAWQAKKAKLKSRIREMADELIRIAAARALRPADPMPPPSGLFDEFCARFPYEETDDQLRAIEETVEDLSAGRPMDRLVCGDVGFGKTEVALRAAFVAAMSGAQVAVVVPTTLLARQHYATFCERFAGFPVRIAQLSRLVTGKAARDTKQGLKDGSIEIVIGTHALLAKTVQFCNLGLLIVDEEQHFGVAHKERLKNLKADVHVLTLTATPIPRTLQMALAGVRELSLIATPPVDRLAVRTFILPYDPVVIREAILRERYRGGQVFYVCPRVADIGRVQERLAALVPEIRTALAHGQMPASELEEVMGRFADGGADLLLSTNIIESGLDMPRVNTIIIHRADMFGLAQLYQLRGRVGRAKARGYAYLTLPPGQTLTKTAEQRLQVMQTLDSLGAGFSLASHDMDIRGAGNLLGEEQSGHIREVGIELYQQMLAEAVEAAKEADTGGAPAETESFSPQIGLGVPVLIPEDYVPELGLRLGFYRRIADLMDRADADALAAELIDRFGPLPESVKNLFEVVSIKALCRIAHVEKVDAGPKGVVITFFRNSFPNPEGLVRFIARQGRAARLRPDHKLVLQRDWGDGARKIEGVRRILTDIADVAAEAGP